jgi:hypothetical protein
MVVLYPNHAVLGDLWSYRFGEEAIDHLVSFPIWLTDAYLIYLIMQKRP